MKAPQRQDWVPEQCPHCVRGPNKDLCSRRLFVLLSSRSGYISSNIQQMFLTPTCSIQRSLGHLRTIKARIYITITVIVVRTSSSDRNSVAGATFKYRAGLLHSPYKRNASRHPSPWTRRVRQRNARCEAHRHLQTVPLVCRRLAPRTVQSPNPRRFLHLHQRLRVSRLPSPHLLAYRSRWGGLDGDCAATAHPLCLLTCGQVHASLNANPLTSCPQVGVLLGKPPILRRHPS